MTELERILAETGATLEWPATPDIEATVNQRIHAAGLAGAPPRGRRVRIGRPLAVALAAVLVLASAAAAVPGIRDPVFDLLGLRSVKIERVPGLPVRPAPGAGLGLGAPVTLEAATRKLAFRPLLPTGLGAPTVYVDPLVPGGRLGLFYRPSGLLLSELEGELPRTVLQKLIQPGTTIEHVMVDRDRGLWLSGPVHEIAYLDASGTIRPDTVRLAGDVLLWRHHNLLLRLEGTHSKARALRIARTARSAP